MNDTHPIRMLARQYPQLCLPIMPNERETEEYRACVLMGEPVRRAPEFAFSEEDEFSFVSTPVGEGPGSGRSGGLCPCLPCAGLPL